MDTAKAPGSRQATIGDKECTGKLCKHSGLYHIELWKDGGFFDMTLAVKTQEKAWELFDEMVKSYQKALRSKEAFGDFVREEFMNQNSP